MEEETARRIHARLPWRRVDTGTADLVGKKLVREKATDSTSLRTIGRENLGCAVNTAIYGAVENGGSAGRLVVILVVLRPLI
jgi:hypothetical protein